MTDIPTTPAPPVPTEAQIAEMVRQAILERLASDESLIIGTRNFRN